MVPTSDRDHTGAATPGTSGVADEQLDDVLSIVDDFRRQLKNSKEMIARLGGELTASQKKAIAAETRALETAAELERTAKLLAECQSDNETLISEAVAGQEDVHESAREIHRLRQELSAVQDATRSHEEELGRLRKIGAELAEQAAAREAPLRTRVEELEQELEERTRKMEDHALDLHRVNVALSDLAKEKEALQAEVETLARYRRAMGKIHGALKGDSD
jgi:chromosome segregation ATPase